MKALSRTPDLESSKIKPRLGRACSRVASRTCSYRHTWLRVSVYSQCVRVRAAVMYITHERTHVALGLTPRADSKGGIGPSELAWLFSFSTKLL